MITSCRRATSFASESNEPAYASAGPAPAFAEAFRTPLPGYYFGAAGAHPGGGVMGAPGKLAADAILKDVD